MAGSSAGSSSAGSAGSAGAGSSGSDGGASVAPPPQAARSSANTSKKGIHLLILFLSYQSKWVLKLQAQTVLLNSPPSLLR
jgi:hypothetical protein